ncbi:MAG: toxin-antitoxin system HicB family antitoxin [Gammaproteobacteria bacterium]|nr:MAG: toxin-antitoxin system HicB family antitoxin [Gammaproteobacteria bacterium]
MNNQVDKYTYRVIWSEEDQEHIGLCAEFPSLSWLSESPQKALEGITDVVKKCIEDMQQHNESIPQPIAYKKYSGKFNVRPLHNSSAV